MADDPPPPRPPLAIELRGIPEIIWACRHEMAALLRQQADADVSPLVARRLREIADRFEAGT